MKGLKKRKKANDCNLDKLLFSNKNSLDFIKYLYTSVPSKKNILQKDNT